MSRQVDVKALVSHVLRGDGVNKCRICMGDTSEGQVHLSDTVIMEGDKPVTLSELLEIVTGIQVPLDGDLPAGVCTECSTCALNAANFRSMCREISSKWDIMLQLFYNLPSQCSEKDKIMFAILDDNQMIVVLDKEDLNEQTAFERLGTHLSPQMDIEEVIKEECETKEVVKNVQPNIKRNESGHIVIKNERLVKRQEHEEAIKYKKLEEKRVKREESEQKEDPSVRIPQCPNCNKTFRHPIKLYHHLRGSTDMTRACHICSEIMTRDELVSHLDKAHNIDVYDCKKCPALLLTNNKYIQHLTKVHSRGACSCIDCGQTFQSHQAFCAHMSVHRRKTCPTCDKIFHNQTCYLYHIKNCCHLDEGRDFKKAKMTVECKIDNINSNVRVGTRGSTDEVCICDYCSKTFAKKKYVTAHIQIVHMKNTHRPCAYCGKLLATSHMTEHLKKHELDLSFTCGHCGIVLKSKLGYIQHLRLHTGERPYPCKICNETFSASSRRSEHMRKQHSGPGIVLKHACKLCPAKFRLPYRLKKHMKSSHVNESEESLQFECPECHEKFGTGRGLLHHSRKHQKVDFPHKRPEKTIMLKLSSEPDCVKEK